MSQSRLITLTYYDPGKSVRLTVYADTIILDRNGNDSVISAVRFGGYPEVVRAMSDAIYGGATIEMPINGQTRQLKSVPKQYRRQMSHDGLYAVGALHGLWASRQKSEAPKTFNLIMCPSHITKKWVREIGETLPDTYAKVDIFEDFITLLGGLNRNKPR